MQHAISSNLNIRIRGVQDKNENNLRRVKRREEGGGKGLQWALLALHNLRRQQNPIVCQWQQMQFTAAHGIHCKKCNSLKLWIMSEFKSSIDGNWGGKGGGGGKWASLEWAAYANNVMLMGNFLQCMPLGTFVCMLFAVALFYRRHAPTREQQPLKGHSNACSTLAYQPS